MELSLGKSELKPNETTEKVPLKIQVPSPEKNKSVPKSCPLLPRVNLNYHATCHKKLIH